MVIEYDVDINLLYLEKLIFSLQLYRFDEDILELLNKLKKLLVKKLYSSLPEDNYKIVDECVKLKFYLEKEKKQFT